MEKLMTEETQSQERSKRTVSASERGSGCLSLLVDQDSRLVEGNGKIRQTRWGVISGLNGRTLNQ